MPEIRRYRKLPVEISAIELRAYGDFVRARDWINANDGSAAFCPNVETEECKFPDHLLIETLDGTMEASVGWFIIQGIKGEFYPCDGDIFRLTYEAVEVPEVEALTGTGSYVVGRPDGRTSLVGGAAKRLMSGVADD